MRLASRETGSSVETSLRDRTRDWPSPRRGGRLSWLTWFAEPIGSASLSLGSRVGLPCSCGDLEAGQEIASHASGHNRPSRLGVAPVLPRQAMRPEPIPASYVARPALSPAPAGIKGWTGDSQPCKRAPALKARGG